MLGDSAICVGFGLRSRYPVSELRRLFSNVKSVLGDADIVFGNLETVLSDLGFDPNDLKSAQMRGDPAYAQELRQAGFTMVSVANNHANQHGLTAFKDSLDHLKTAGIAYCGVRGTEPWFSLPSIVTANE